MGAFEQLVQLLYGRELDNKLVGNAFPPLWCEDVKRHYSTEVEKTKIQ